jgi:O6-methylguanine-DNA--protein-cysteine methyltransferase
VPGHVLTQEPTSKTPFHDFKFRHVPSQITTSGENNSCFCFQRWNALEEIPAGQTVTYKELALKLGATAQEIGEACAANAHAVAIPCH